MRTIKNVLEHERFSAAFLLDVAATARMFPEERVLDTLYRGQVASKVHLVRLLETLPECRAPLDVAVCGGWYGVLPRMITDLSKTLVPWRVRLVDTDERCVGPAIHLNESLNPGSYVFRFNQTDMTTADYRENLVVNTAVEHLTVEQRLRWFGRIGRGTVVALQGNSKTEPDHPSPVLSFDDLRFDGLEIVVEDSLLMYGDAIRRTVIGIKR